jgi:hypothetical protein
MRNFTPISGLIGRAMIGIATALFLIFNGRIAGISGILGGLLPLARGDVAWRVSFMFGIFAAPRLYAAVGGHLSPISISGSVGTLIVAGARGLRDAPWVRLHQRSRRVRPWTRVSTLPRRNPDLCAGRGRDGIYHPSPRASLIVARTLSSLAVVCFRRRHDGRHAAV